jgi:glucose/arabinose dehydrogenase
VGTFSFPVLVTAPTGDSDRLFVVEKRGTVRIVRQGTTLATAFLDLSGKVSTGGEQGLLGLAFHPQYQSNGLFVVHYTDQGGDTKVSLFRVSAADPNRADPASEQTFLTVTQPFANHNGGSIAFHPVDGHFYLGLGDGGSGGDPQGNGQKLSTLLGKLLRLSISSSGQVTVPSDNPFAGQGSARAEIWSYGLRNPWRWSFDRTTGDLYIGDVGQNQREEIDVTTLAGARGANFGWNVMEGRACYQAGSCDQTGLTLPVLDYSHGNGACSVTGGYVYRGSAIPSLVGTYFYADYCSGWVRSFRYASGAISDEREWTALAPNGQITSFGEDAQGELYLMTAGGRVARIVASP